MEPLQQYLVVANLTLGGDHLLDEIRRRVVQAGPYRFHVLVPATPPQEHLTWSEEEAHDAAELRLSEALRRFREIGADVTGEVGPSSPLDAIAGAIARGRFDGIILSTLPAGASRWLKLDL